MNKCGCKGLVEGFGGGRCRVTNESHSQGGHRGADCPAAKDSDDAPLCCGVGLNECDSCLLDPRAHFGMSPSLSATVGAASAVDVSGGNENDRDAADVVVTESEGTQQCSSLDRNFCKINGRNGNTVLKTSASATYLSDTEIGDQVSACCRKPRNCSEWKNTGGTCNAPNVLKPNPRGISLSPGNVPNNRCCAPPPAATQAPPTPT
jgi:hypothetical protein